MLRKFLTGLAGTLIVLVGLTWVILRVKQDTIRLKAEQLIDEYIEAWVSFDDLSASFLKDFPNLTITLHHVLVKGKGDFVMDTLAVAEELDFRLRTTSLFYGRATELKSIHLYRPLLNLIVLRNGHANYDIFRSDSLHSHQDEEDPSHVHIALDEILMNEGKVDYHNQAIETQMIMKGVSFSGSGDLQNDLFDLTTHTSVNEFDLDYGKIRLLSKKEVEVDLVMQMNVLQKSFTLKENNIRINNFRVGLQGSFSLLEHGYDLDLSFGAKETEFRNIVSLVPGIFMEDFKQITTRGELSFKGFVSGQYVPGEGKIPSLLTEIKVADALFKIDTLPNQISDIHMQLMVKNLYGIRDSTEFDLKNIQFVLENRPVTGRLKIKGLDNLKIDTDIIAGVDLAELEEMYPVKGVDLRGLVDFELRAKGPLSINGTSIKKLPAFHLDMRLRNGRLQYDQLPAAIDSIHFHLVADNPSGEPEQSLFDFRRIHMDLGKNTIHGFVRLAGYNNINVNSDLKAELDLADLESLYPVDGWVMKGILKMNMAAMGTYNKNMKKFPALDARVSLTDGFLQTRNYQEPLEDIHLSGEIVNKTGQFSDTQFSIEKLTYTLESEPFEVRGTVSNLESYNYDFKVKGLVDLEKLTKIYPMEGLVINGTIYSDFETRGRLIDLEAGQYEKTLTNGKVEVKNLSVRRETIPHPLLINDALFTFTPTKVVLESLAGRFGRSTVSVHGDLFNYMAFATRTDDLIRGELFLTCDTLDVNEWLSEDKHASGRNDEKNKITAWQVPPTLDMVFDSDIQYVLYEDMKISNLDGRIAVKDGILTLHETGFNSLNAEFNLSGDYNTRDITHPTFDFDLDIKELDIAKSYKELKLVRELLPAAGDAEGLFSITYKLKGDLLPDLYPKMETLKGGGEIRISNAKINGMKIFEELSKASKKQEVNDPHLKDFVMRSEIRDSRIYVKPFSVKVSGFDADIEGVSEISGAMRYLVKIQLPPLGLKIPFHVTGNYDDPKVSIGKGHVLSAADSLGK